MKIFTTKYALTAGIQYYENAEQHRDTPLVTVPKEPESSYRLSFYGEGKEWHRTFADAVERAEQIRKDRIISLNKSLSKLRARDFSVDPSIQK